MMDAGEMLGRATASGTRYEVYVGGGVVSFTQAEVGECLAGLRRKDGVFKPLPDGVYRLLLLRYAGGDGNDLRALIDALLADAGRTAHWQARAAHTTICRATVREFLRARRCTVCQGRQTVLVGDRVEHCASCGGTGYQQHTAKTRAEEVGIPPTTFRKGPAERFYIDRMRRLVEWEDRGLRRVVRKARS